MDFENIFDDIGDGLYSTTEDASGRGSFYPSSHNTAPLTVYPQQKVFDYFKTFDKVHTKVKVVREGINLVESYSEEKHLGTNLKLTVDASPVYYYLFKESHKETLTNNIGRKTASISKMCYIAGVECLEAELNGLMKHHKALTVEISEHVRILLKDKSMFTRVNNSFALRELLETLKNKIQYEVVRQSSTIIKDTIGDLELRTNGSILLAYFKSIPDEVMLLNYDQYVMIVDTIISRSCSLLACLINEKTNQTFLPTVTELRRIYSWGDECINRHGYQAYAALGEFESLLTCRMIRFEGSDPLNLGEGYENSIIEASQEIFEEYGVDPRWVQDLFVILNEINSMSKFAEIFGIRKHWGNPMLDAEMSGRAVQDKAAEVYPIDPKIRLMVFASFQRMVTLAYIQKEGRWPKCQVLEGYEDTPLGKSCLSRSIKINEQAVGHEFKHWAGIRFLKNVTVDKCLNPLDLLSDKSCSLYKPNLDSIYVTGYRTDKNLSNVPRESRRILLEYLRKDHLTIEQIFKHVQSGEVPDDWLVNLCALKGTEMKHLKGRIFAVLPYELRQYFAGTEELIKKYIFPYNPHQTMTMKEDHLSKLLSEITGQLNPDSKSKELSVVHIIDFSKWNLRMSKGNTEDIFRSMDDFMGTPKLIEATHYLFQKMLNVVQDPFNPPKDGVLNTRSSTIWSGHGRGWEGQRQKGWTAITSALLAFLEYLTGVFSRILGQGDNQILVSKFRVPDQYLNAHDWITKDPEGVRKTLDNFYDTLVDSCLKMGLPVKKSETCRSLVFCNYGKRLYQCGIELTMELKRISRIATEANDSFPTTDSLLKTMTSSASASPIYGPPSLTSLLIGHMNVALTIHRAILRNPLAGPQMHEQFSILGQEVNASFLKRLMWIPACLGGPNRTTLLGSLFRGHPDPIAADIATITLSARSGSPFHKKLLAYLRDSNFVTEGKPVDTDDLLGLIKSPYSLNLDTYGRALGPLHAAVGDAVRDYCGNSTLKPLFSLDTDRIEQEIVKSLVYMKPFHPVIANEILSRSLPGRRSAFLAGFKNTTSFSQLLSCSSDGLRERVAKREIEQILWWSRLVIAINNTNYSTIKTIPEHHALLHWLREVTWGVEMKGVTVPHPAEAMSLTLSNAGMCTSVCNAYYKDRIDLVLLDDERMRLFGSHSNSRLNERLIDHRSYTGNRIQEGMICRTLRAVNSSTSLEDAVRLNVLRRWITVSGSNLDVLLRLIIAQRTNLTITELDELSGIPVRLSYTHRVSSIATKKKCSAACNTNLHSQIYISSNNMTELSRSDVNFAFVFGQSFLMGQHLIGLNEFYGSNQTTYNSKACYHEHVYIKDISEVYDGTIESDHTTKHLSSGRTSCSLLFAERNHIELEVRGNRIIPQDWQVPSTSSIFLSKIAFGVQMVGDTFIKEERLRSFLNVDHFLISNKRDAPLTVGDVMGIGLDNYFTSISLCLCFYLPFDIIFNQEKHGNMCKTLETLVYKMSEKTWSHLLAPLLMPGPLQVLSRLIHPNIPSDFGVNLHSILRPCLNLIVQRVGALLHGHRNRLLYRKDLGKSAPTEFIIFSDGPDSTRFLLSKYLEINCALFAAIYSTKSKLKCILEARGAVSTLYKKDLRDNHPALLTMAAVSFINFQRSVLRSSTSRTFSLPMPIFADLNKSWGSVVREHKESQELIYSELHSFERVPRMVTSKVRMVVENANEPPNLVPLKCTCFNFIRTLNYPIERFFTITGVTSKDHYSIAEILSEYDLDTCQVSFIGYKTAVEVLLVSNLAENIRNYWNPLIPLSKFADHSAASFIPPELVTSSAYEKLVFCSEAILSQPVKTPILDVSCIAAHLMSSGPWTGMVFNCDPVNNHDGDEVSTLLSIGNIVHVAHQTTGPTGWVLIELPLCCDHFLESAMTILGTYFTVVQLRASAYQSYPSGHVFLLGLNKKDVRIDTITWSNNCFLSSFSVDESIELKRVVSIISNLRIPLVARQTKKLPSTEEFHAVFSSGLKNALDNYLGGITPFMDSPSRDFVIFSLENVKNELLSLASLVFDYTDRVFDGKPVCTGMVLMLSGSDVSGQLNEVGYLYHRVVILLAILSSKESLTIEAIIKMIIFRLTQKNTMRVKVLDKIEIVETKISLSHFITIYSGSLFEIIGSILWANIPKQLFKIKFVDLHFREKKVPSSEASPILEMDFESLQLEPPNLDFKWEKKSLLLFFMLAKGTRCDDTVILVNKVETWINSITNVIGLSHHLDFKSVASVEPQLNITLVLISPKLIRQFFNMGLWKVYKAFCLIDRSLLSSLKDKGLFRVIRPSFMGIVPSAAWAEFHPDGGYCQSNFRETSWSSIKYVWDHMTTLSECRCNDCALSHHILSSQTRFTNDTVNHLASKDDFLESDFDLYHP